MMLARDRSDRVIRRGIITPARWLSIRAIAADLGVAISTAHKWSARGVPS